MELDSFDIVANLGVTIPHEMEPINDSGLEINNSNPVVQMITDGKINISI